MFVVADGEMRRLLAYLKQAQSMLAFTRRLVMIYNPEYRSLMLP